MKKNSQTIKCHVESCSHCAPDHFCDLKQIKVCACAPCDCDDVTRCEQSMCASFEEKGKGFF